MNNFYKKCIGTLLCTFGFHSLKPLINSPIGSKICTRCEKIVVPKWAEAADKKFSKLKDLPENKDKSYCEIVYGDLNG